MSGSRRWIAIGLFGLGCLDGVNVASSELKPDPALDRYARAQRLVSLPDGRKLNLLCEGSGEPTVILEAGAGGSTLVWRKVQPSLARVTRVCAYDRAGMGFSDAGPLPRTASAVVADLEALLSAASIQPPYLLVAHSLGSYYVRLYADRHIGNVAGMVLVDPSVEYQDRRIAEINPQYETMLRKDRETAQECLRLARQGKLTPELPVFKACTYGYARDPSFSDALFEAELKRRTMVSFRETLLSETDQMETDSRELVDARHSYGDIPLTILTQSPEPRESYPELTAAQVEAMNKLWMRMHDELATLSTRGKNLQVDRSGHYIQIDRPEVVIDAFGRAISAGRKAPQ